jgi:hypothetical protein
VGTLLVSNLGRLVTGNRTVNHILGDADALAPPYDRHLRVQSHRTVWFARPGDVLVVPTPIDQAFFDYATSLRGFRGDDVTVLVPKDGDIVEQVRQAVKERQVDRFWPYYFDRTAAAFAVELGLRVPDFIGQGGAELLNSRVLFRALAAGLGVPIADGRIPVAPAEAEAHVWRLVSSGRSVIVKQDFHAGGLGNEIASPYPELRLAGPGRVEVCTTRDDVKRFVARQWSHGGIIVEHYVSDSRSIYVGYVIGDDGIRAYGQGEMRMPPVVNGLVTPSPNGSSAPFAAFLEHSARLAESVRVMGYRGLLSVDGVLTPDGDVFLTEFNARSDGATHNHCIMTTMVDAENRPDRIMLDHRRCDLPALGPLLAALDAEGVAFDPAERSGTVITAHDGGSGGETGEFCVVAPDLRTAEAMEDTVTATIARLGGTVHCGSKSTRCRAGDSTLY